MTLHGETAAYRDSDGCKLTFKRVRESIDVTEDSGPEACGEAMGVSLGGKYLAFAAVNAKPSPDLVSLKVLDNRNENDAARALLGADYDTLLSTINVGGDVDDLDHFGAKVQSFLVRGLATTNAAIVMHRSNELWIGVTTGVSARATGGPAQGITIFPIRQQSNPAAQHCAAFEYLHVKGG